MEGMLGVDITEGILVFFHVVHASTGVCLCSFFFYTLLNLLNRFHPFYFPPICHDFLHLV